MKARKPLTFWSGVVLLSTLCLSAAILSFLLFSLQPKQIPPDHDLLRFRTECAPPLEAPQVLPALLRHFYGNVSPYADFPPPQFSKLLGHVGVQGWGSTNSVFEELIRSVRPKTIIEVGTFLGASALHMARLTRQLGLESTTILCLDDFRGWPGFKGNQFRDIKDVNGDVMLMYEFMRNVIDAKEEHRVLPVPYTTAAGLDALCDLGVYGDLVEVDAGHDFHSVWTDINRAWAVLRTGGVLFGHDYYNAVHDYGVRRAVQLFAELKGLEVKANGEHWILHPPKSHWQSQAFKNQSNCNFK